MVTYFTTFWWFELPFLSLNLHFQCFWICFINISCTCIVGTTLVQFHSQKRPVLKSTIACFLWLSYLTYLNDRVPGSCVFNFFVSWDRPGTVVVVGEGGVIWSPILSRYRCQMLEERFLGGDPRGESSGVGPNQSQVTLASQNLTPQISTFNICILNC